MASSFAKFNPCQPCCVPPHVGPIGCCTDFPLPNDLEITFSYFYPACALLAPLDGFTTTIVFIPSNRDWFYTDDTTIPGYRFRIFFYCSDILSIINPVWVVQIEIINLTTSSSCGFTGYGPFVLDCFHKFVYFQGIWSNPSYELVCPTCNIPENNSIFNATIQG